MVAAAAEEESQLGRGSPVLLRGLRSGAEYNGMRGIVVSVGLLDSGRYEVELQPEDGQAEAKILALKPANLRLDVEALQDFVSKRRVGRQQREPPLEDLALFWLLGKGLSARSLAVRVAPVREIEDGEILLRVDSFALNQISLGYLMKGFSQSSSAYHDFFASGEEDCYRSGCWGRATVVESRHSGVGVGTRLYGLMPPSRFAPPRRVAGILPCADGQCVSRTQVELAFDRIPFDLRRFQEYSVLSEDAEVTAEDWEIATRECFTAAFYIDEQILVDAGAVSCVVISCASSKTAQALAYCLRQRGLRQVVALTSSKHLSFVESTELYHEVLAYDDVEQCLRVDRAAIFVDFRCDGDVRSGLARRLGTHLMKTLVIGPAAFQRSGREGRVESHTREVAFDMSAWRQRRRQAAEFTKTGRDELLIRSYAAFLQRIQSYMSLSRAVGEDAIREAYSRIASNQVSPAELTVCSLHAP